MAAPHVSLLADASFQAPLDVTFGSGLPSQASVEWRFGDGEQGSGTSVHHIFYLPGRYTVEVSMSLGGHQYRATIPVEVRSSGPERAAAVVLLDDTGLSLALGSQGSVVYAPATPRFVLDGQVVGGARQPLRAGTHSVQVTVRGASGTLEHQVSFQSGPVQRRPDYDAEVVRLTNQARAAGWDCARQANVGPSRPPLTENAQLAAAARAQSSGMALNGYFDHRSAVDGSLPDARIRASGYLPARDAENIAAGQLSPQEVVTAWLKSPGHCANIMGDYREIGVSYVHLEGSRSLDYWTQEFGTQGAVAGS
ncbi:hypothetical protein GCM10008957_17740 [Deinococcus ruber]|uniref:PKD domain-containing protein n=1 Tax=Deinococcus ruber TaxID=1848197 RepID=A0A918F685_9DEIO|nr:hypothetical protein GCM10008957_17740 [Deinococcus ruber]